MKVIIQGQIIDLQWLYHLEKYDRNFYLYFVNSGCLQFTAPSLKAANELKAKILSLWSPNNLHLENLTPEWKS